jgi:hypothetical protein
MNNKKGLDAVKAGFMQDKLELLQELRRIYGQGVLDVACQRNQTRTLREWQQIGEQLPAITIAALVDVLWQNFCQQDGLEFTEQRTTDKIQMHCTYCPWVEVAKAAGATEIGYQLICRSDEAIVAGFNQAARPHEPKINFTRTKTLMQGDDCCDHCYTYAP